MKNNNTEISKYCRSMYKSSKYRYMYNSGVFSGFTEASTVVTETFQNFANQVLEDNTDLSSKEKNLSKAILNLLLDEVKKNIETRKKSRYFENRLSSILSSIKEEND